MSYLLLQSISCSVISQETAYPKTLNRVNSHSNLQHVKSHQNRQTKAQKKSKGKLKKRSNINHESGLMQKGSTWALWKSDVVIDRDKYEGCGQKWRVCHSPRHAIHNRKKASREEKALWWAKGGRNRGRWGVKEQQQNWDRRRGWGSNSGREGSIVRYVVNR